MIYIYTHTYIYTPPRVFRYARSAAAPNRLSSPNLSLYKILFHFKALLWESIIFLCPTPPAKPTLLQY